MLICMRTTININDQLLRSAKRLAAESNRTLTSVIEDGLRRILDNKNLEPTKRRFVIPTFGSGGLLPGVDLDDSAALLDRMETQE